MVRIRWVITIGLLGLLLLNAVAWATPTTANAATAPGYVYYDYSRADWGANPAYDSRKELRSPANAAPYTVAAADLDDGKTYYTTIQPGQVISPVYPAQVPTGIAIHDTATPNYSCDFATSAATLRSIQTYQATSDWEHVGYGPGNPDPRHEINNQGVPFSTFGDMAYHFLIDCAGRVFEGRAGGVLQEAEHVHRHNFGQIGIALIGSFENQQPSPAQRAALIKLVTRLCRDFHIDPLAVWHQQLDNGQSETLSKNNQPVYNIAGHVNFPDNDHTDPGVLDLNAVRHDVAAALAPGADAQSFSQTNQALTEPFRSYWEANGGLPIFGYPIGPMHVETNSNDNKQYLVQYFERARFELHPELVGTPYYVELGQLGLIAAQKAKAAIPNPFYSVSPPANNPSNSVFYSKETGHTIRHGFLAYWQANGGVAIFGLPLSEEFVETDADGHAYAVQYFERARFEYHPEAPPGFTVQLTRLGVSYQGKLSIIVAVGTYFARAI